MTPVFMQHSMTWVPLTLPSEIYGWSIENLPHESYFEEASYVLYCRKIICKTAVRSLLYNLFNISESRGFRHARISP